MWRDIAGLPPGLVQRVKPFAVEQNARDDVEPFISGGAVHSGELRQVFALAENLLDHEIERLPGEAARVADQVDRGDECLSQAVADRLDQRSDAGGFRLERAYRRGDEAVAVRPGRVCGSQGFRFGHAREVRPFGRHR